MPPTSDVATCHLHVHCHLCHCFSVGGIIGPGHSSLLATFPFRDYLPPSLNFATLPPSFVGDVATRPRLPPPCNVATDPTVSQWVATLPLVRACHLSISGSPFAIGICHLPPTLPPATSMQRCLLCHPSAPATFPFWVPLAMAATFVRPCHLPPPYNVTTHPTVSQWVASLPLVRACHLSFSRLLATFPQLCHLATFFRW